MPTAKERSQQQLPNSKQPRQLSEEEPADRQQQLQNSPLIASQEEELADRQQPRRGASSQLQNSQLIASQEEEPTDRQQPRRGASCQTANTASSYRHSTAKYQHYQLSEEEPGANSSCRTVS